MKTISESCRPARRTAHRLAAAAAALSGLLIPLAAAPSASAATLDAHVSYVKRDSRGYPQYDVRFNGTVRPDGPTGYVVEGTLDAYCPDNTLTGQSITLGYRNWNGTWEYKSYWCTDAPVTINLTDTRHHGGSVELIVGATSGVFNSYEYGKDEFYQIGLD